MSLLIWCPLNGNINNYGTTNIKFNSDTGSMTGITINTKGKTGGSCYYRTHKAKPSLIASEGLLLENDMTMCCWVKVIGVDGNANNTNGIISFFNNQQTGKYGGFGINAKYISRTNIRFGCSIGAGSSYNFTTHYCTTNIMNNWHHLCLTYSKANKQVKLYVDGNLEYILENHINYSRNLQFSIFGDIAPIYNIVSNAANAKLAYGYLNDVRLYDECLTSKQLNDLFNTKILHYPLNDELSIYNNIVYDVSGFSNNTSIQLNDSPILDNTDYIIGDGCYHFSNTNFILNNKFLMDTSMSDYTISFWLKSNSVDYSPFCTTQSNNLCFYYSNNHIVSLNTNSNGDSNPFIMSDGSIYKYISGEWIHYVFVYTSTKVSLYVNGNYIGDAKQYIAMNTTGFYINSNSNGNFRNCEYISDYRIYASALSESDIKDLYETRFCIDENSIFYCNNVREDTDYTGFMRNGNFLCHDCIEIDAVTDDSIKASFYNNSIEVKKIIED